MLVAMSVAFALVAFFLIRPSISVGQSILGLIALSVIMAAIYHLLKRTQLSFSLTFMHIQHHSLKGGWVLKWKNIRSIGIPTISREGWHQPVPWVGIQIKDYDALLESISLRMVSHIIMTQRALLVTAYRRSDATPSSAIEDMMFDDKPYLGENGVVYKGLLAMLANRMQYMREILGYDLFISDDLLDRPVEEFVGLTRKYLAAAPEDEPPQ